MILSNVEILRCIKNQEFAIENLSGHDPSKPPFNTSAVDLRLGTELQMVKQGDYPVAIDLRKPGIANLLQKLSIREIISEDRPYQLKHGQFLLGQTMERVSFPFNPEAGRCFSARVEGKSSLARCGIIVHFTAPTIHAGFHGPITLEIINLGPFDFMLYPGMFVCQLIIEEVCGIPMDAPNQFKGQSSPSGANQTNL